MGTRKNLSALLLTCLLPTAAIAHEGHDHEEAQVSVTSADRTAERLALNSSRVELVAAREGRELVIYIDDFASNAPLEGLQLQVRSGTRLLQAEDGGDGIYKIPADLLDSGAQQLTFALQGEGWEEELSGILPAAVVSSPPQSQQHLSLTVIAVLGLLALPLAVLWWIRRRRNPA